MGAASTSSPDSYSFWASAIAPQYDDPVKTFYGNTSYSGSTDYANFSYYSGVTNWRTEGGMLKFTATSSTVTLGWGYYTGTQPLEDVQEMWQEDNDISIRIKGSLGATKTLTSKLYARGGPSGPAEKSTTLAGSSWATVIMEQNNGTVFPTSDGFKLTITGTSSGENFEIEWVKLTSTRCQGYLRKEFTLPAGTVWRAIAEVGAPPEFLWYGWNKITAKLYINGVEVRRNHTGYLYHTSSIDISSYLQPGTNCIAFYGYRVKYKPQCYFQSRIIMADGTDVEWRTDGTWKSNPSAGAGWNNVGYDDSTWDTAQGAYGIYVNTSGDGGSDADTVPMAAYDGYIDIRNPDPIKRELFYEEGMNVLMDVYVPQGLKTPSPDPFLRYYLRQPAADGSNGTLLATVDVTSFTEVDNSLKYSINLGDGLTDGIYTIGFDLMRGTSVIKSRGREPFTVVTNHGAAKIEGTSYMDGLVEGVNMDLEDTINFANPADPHPNKEYSISSSGASTEVMTPNIVTVGDRTYRQVVGSERSSFFTYRFDLDHQGDFYLCELEYPDDDDRLIEVSISHKAQGEWDNSVAAVGAETGRTFYRTYKMQKLRWLFRATHATAYSVDVVNGEDGLHSAAANLKIYHITGDLPAIRMGEDRNFGIHSERTASTSGIGNNFGLAKSYSSSGTLMQRTIREMQWMKETYDHYVQYLKFAGQNMHIMGGYQYMNRNTPALVINHTKGSRTPDCFRAVLANYLEINDINFYLGMEFSQYWGESEGLNTDAQVAQGADTCWMVTSSGQQYVSDTRSTNIQNWLNPSVRQKFMDHMNAWGMQYKQFTHFKGAHSVSGPAGHPIGYWGPAFVQGHATAANYNDPLYFSYDDYTFNLFYTDTGNDVYATSTATNRFSLRKSALQSNSTLRNAYYQWRCEKYAEWLEEAVNTLKAQRSDLSLLNEVMNEDNEFFEDWLNSGQTYEDYLHTMAFDFDELHAVDGLWTGRWTISFKESWRFSLQYSQSPYLWLAKLDPRITDAYDTTDNRLVFVRASWDENQCASAGYNVGSVNPVLLGGSDWLMQCYRIRVEPQPAGYQCREPMIDALISGDPQVIVFGWTDLAINLSNEHKHRTFSKIFSQLPAEKFSPVLSTGFDTNFVIRKLVKAGETWIYVANPGYWPISGSLLLDENNTVLNLATNAAATLTPVGDNFRLSLSLEPYGLAGYKISSDTIGVVSYENSGIPYRELAYLEELLANAQYIMSLGTVRSALSTAELAEVDGKLVDASTALTNGDYAKVFKLLYEIPVVLDVNGVNWKSYGFFDQAEVDIPGANQVSYIWAPDADVDADALAWQSQETTLQFNPEDTYILGVQITLETNETGDWALQYQEDYDTGTPGAWTDVTSGNTWEPDTAHEMNLSNNAEVQTGWYAMSAPIGYTVASGEFSNDGVVTDDYLMDKYVELWYAVKPAATSANHSYRFRVIKTSTDFSYPVYPLANFNYPIRQTGAAMAEDQESVAPSAVAWNAENTEIIGAACTQYLISIQIALNDNQSGDWVLQYQEDYDEVTPGPWTSVAADTIWRPRSWKVTMSNNDEVDTAWYSISAPSGTYTAANGEFSGDADGINDNYAIGKYVELWYSLYADVNTHGHNYRFRVIKAGSDFNYEQYALIDFLSEGTKVFQEGVDGYTGTMDVNLRRWTSVGKEADPPADVGERAHMRQGPAYGDFSSVGQYTAFLVYFDGVQDFLEALPNGTIIQDASLTVYQWSGATSTNAAVEVSAVTDPNEDGMWTETTSYYPDGYNHVDTNAAYRRRDVAWTVPHIIEEIGPPQVLADCGDHGPEVDYSQLLSGSGYHTLDVLPIITEWQSTEVYQGFHLTTGLHHYDGTNSYFSYFITHEGALGTAVNQYVLGGSEQAEWAPKLEITYTVPAYIPGDIDRSDKVDFADFTLLKIAYSSQPGDINWNENADLDNTGKVDFADFLILRDHYGEER
ncbi:MAG: hypothetical protein JXA52_06190 [Planctomycetes bacterium]|nr:hypothetical protein [Planctomycetota bacterium]